MIQILTPQEIRDLLAYYQSGILSIRKDRIDLIDQFRGAMGPRWMEMLIAGEDGEYVTYTFDDGLDYEDYEDGRLLDLLQKHSGLHAQAVAIISLDRPHGGFRSLIQNGLGSWCGDFLIPMSGHRGLRFGWDDSWEEVMGALPDGHPAKTNYDPEFFTPQPLGSQS